MVGTLQGSRALAHRQLAAEVLEQGIQNALALLVLAACMGEAGKAGYGDAL